MCNIKIWELSDLVEVGPIFSHPVQGTEDLNTEAQEGQGICLRLGSVFWTCEFSLALLFSILNLFWEFHGGWNHFSSLHWNLWKHELKWGTVISAPKVDSYLIQIHQRKLVAFTWLFRHFPWFGKLRTFSSLIDYLEGPWKRKDSFDFKKKYTRVL